MAYSKKTKEKFAAYEKEISEKDRKIEELEARYQDLNMKYKYSVFDLEATKREKELLRKLIEGEEK